LGPLAVHPSILQKESEEVEKRHTEKESVTFISSRSLLERGDLRRILGHQSNTLRGARACLSYRLGILNILWWEKGGWREISGR
jgi:hypothetical protein